MHRTFDFCPILEKNEFTTTLEKLKAYCPNTYISQIWYILCSDNNLQDLSEMDDFRLELMAIGASQVLQVNINPSWEK